MDKSRWLLPDNTRHTYDVGASSVQCLDCDWHLITMDRLRCTNCYCSLARELDIDFIREPFVSHCYFA